MATVSDKLLTVILLSIDYQNTPGNQINSHQSKGKDIAALVM